MSFGIDIASVDGNKPLTDAQLGVLVQSGLTFAFFRASWDKWGDPTFKHNEAVYRKAGVTIGGYIGPDIRRGAPSPQEQVRTFALNCGLIRGVDFAPVIDIEFPNGIAGTGYTLDEIRGWIGQLILEVIIVFGCLPIVYTSGRVMDDYDADCLRGTSNEVVKGCALWLTRYVRGYHQPPYTGTAPAPRPVFVGDDDNFWIEQTQGDSLGLPGFTNTVDIDQFNYAKPTGMRAGWLALKLRGHDLAAWQAAHGLVPDYIVGPKTFAALSWVFP